MSVDIAFLPRAVGYTFNAWDVVGTLLCGGDGSKYHMRLVGTMRRPTSRLHASATSPPTDLLTHLQSLSTVTATTASPQSTTRRRVLQHPAARPCCYCVLRGSS